MRMNNARAQPTECADRDACSRMLGHLESILGSFVRCPNQRLGDVEMVRDVERRQLLVDWNDTFADYPTDVTLPGLFEAQVERTPEAVALVYENEQLTYLQLNERANHVAAYLRSAGVGPESLIGITVERSLEMVVGLLGILKPGGTFVCFHFPNRSSYIEAIARIVWRKYRDVPVTVRFHKFRYGRDDIVALCRGAGLELVGTRRYAFLPRNLFGRMPGFVRNSAAGAAAVNRVDGVLERILAPVCTNHWFVARKV